jgi:hypothetical protein
MNSVDHYRLLVELMSRRCREAGELGYRIAGGRQMIVCPVCAGEQGFIVGVGCTVLKLDGPDPTTFASFRCALCETEAAVMLEIK